MSFSKLMEEQGVGVIVRKKYIAESYKRFEVVNSHDPSLLEGTRYIEKDIAVTGNAKDD